MSNKSDSWINGRRCEERTPDWGGGTSTARPAPYTVGGDASYESPKERLLRETREAKEQFEAAAERVQASNEETQKRFVNTLDMLENLRSNLLAQCESDLVDLALTMARELAQREITAHPEVVSALAQEGIQRLQQCSVITLHVAPSEYRYMQEQSAHLMESRPTLQLHIVEDERLASGSCVVEGDSAQVDASFDTRLSKMQNALHVQGRHGAAVAQQEKKKKDGAAA